MNEAPPPRIAVALAAYNGELFLQEQLDSILAQVGVEVTVFISIDPSTDQTGAIAAQAADMDARIRLLPEVGRFGGAAPNFLRLLRDIDPSGFDGIAYADQDDIWYADKLSRAWSEMKRDGADGYSSNVVAFWESGQQILVHKAQPMRRWDHLFEAAGPGCTYVISRRLAISLRACAVACRERLGPLEYHDWLTYAYARSNGFSWIIDARPGMAYRQHARNQIGVNSGWRSFARRARRILSGHGFEQACLIGEAVGALHAPPLVLLRNGRRGLLLLALKSAQCRRAPRDRVLFFLMCLAMFFRPADLGRGHADRPR